MPDIHLSLIVRTEKEIGSALRRIRRSKKLTQAQVADAVRLRQATISGLENGKEGIHLATLVSALAALDLELVVRPRAKSVFKEFDDEVEW